MPLKKITVKNPPVARATKPSNPAAKIDRSFSKATSIKSVVKAAKPKTL